MGDSREAKNDLETQVVKQVESKRPGFLLLGTLIVLLILSSFTWAFVTGQSEAKDSLKNYLASTLRMLSSLDKGPADSPTVIEQQFLFEAETLVMTDKVVYQSGEDVKIFHFSTQDTEMHVVYADVFNHQDIGTYEIRASKPNGPFFVSTTQGFQKEVFLTSTLNTTGWGPGWYQVLVGADGMEQSVPFFIEPITADKSVVFIESTDTVKAYVGAGGIRTFYSNDKSLMGNFSRPNAWPMDYPIRDYLLGEGPVVCTDHLINADLVLKRSLIKSGIDLTTMSDEWLDFTINPLEVDLLVLGAHNEYWTERKFANIQRYIDEGGNLLVLGGNTAWRFIERNQIDGFEVFWGLGAMRTKHEAFIVDYMGTQYDGRAYGTYAGFTRADELPEPFRSLNINKEFAWGSTFADCGEEISGASGHETDNLVSQNPKFTVIAKGQNVGGGADVVYVKSDGNKGAVLNFGSIALWHGMEDPDILKIIGAFVDEATNKK